MNCNTVSTLSISYETIAQYDRAKFLSEQLHLPIDNQAQQRLVVTADKLTLNINTYLPLYADFNITTWQRRRDAGKQQGLVRAVKPYSGMKIIDATGGWGRDAAVLASFGAQILILERNLVISALLADALTRQDNRSKEVMQIALMCVDAKDFLSSLAVEDCPELIYLDPMHPVRKKDALVKKELQVLQQLLGPDEDALSLLQIAQQKATRSVVMKWPQYLPSLGNPIRSVPGKTVRFDIYSTAVAT